jgi:two-component system response regulator FlrC
MLPVTLSAAAIALHPGLAHAIAEATGTLAARAVVVAEGEAGGDIVIGHASRATLGRCPSGRLRLSFAAADVAFAGALIAAEVRGDAVPVGSDPSSTALLGLAARVAARDVQVLITGPTGTGKEGLARFIHARSPHCAGPFVAVNCAAIPETMLEATLFGYERGAFTGATASAPGLFRAAAGGTLLLDEVGELPLALQAKLLRALQEREVLPVGATVPVRFDARIIATANRDLSGEVAAGRFRADLFYRLAVFPLMTTALASRPGDILPLTAAIWLRQDIAAWPTPAALARLAAHSWPGNVRELVNVVTRAAVFADGGIVDVRDILFDTPDRPDASLGSDVRAHEFALIRSTLDACAGRRGAAAARLGISERTLRYKLAAMANAPRTTLQ